MWSCAPTPYFAVTDKEGNFDIKDVPPGHYTDLTWSEEGKPDHAGGGRYAGVTAPWISL